MLASVENVAGILKSLLFPVNTCFIIDYKKWKTVTDSFSKTISLLPFTTLFVRLTTRRTSLTKPEVWLSLASTFLNCNISTVNVAFVYMASFIVHMMLMTFVYIIIDVASCIVHIYDVDDITFVYVCVHHYWRGEFHSSCFMMMTTPTESFTENVVGTTQMSDMYRSLLGQLKPS